MQVMQSLHISRNESYEALPGQYKGRVSYKGQHGSLELPLDERLSEEILKLVADSIVRASKDLANQLTAATITQAAAGQLLESRDE